MEKIKDTTGEVVWDDNPAVGGGGGGSWDGDIADINFAGGADIGEALADSDLILVRNTSGSANVVSALSRVWTWIQTKLGTGVATALGINVGSAGAVLVNGGALGTPSSGTLTDCSGLPVSGITASTTTALGVGSVEIGHASDTTLSRSSAGVVAVEGVVLARLIASGTAALGTSAIASNTAATLVTVVATGVATTDVINWTPNTNLNSVTGYATSIDGCLSIDAYPTAGNVNFLVRNPTIASITPGALTLNWIVVR